jgi:anti-sigma B factor antagonist
VSALEPVIVRLPTEIDMANTESVAEQLCSAFTPGVAIVVADMTSTVFCDSSGMSALVMAHPCAQAHDAQLRLAVTSGQVRRVLSVTGLDRVLSIYPSRAAALDGEPTPSASGGPTADLTVAAPRNSTARTSRMLRKFCAPMTGRENRPYLPGRGGG